MSSRCSGHEAVTLLETFDDLPSDENFLNNQLMVTNDMFDSLLEIEDALVNDEVKNSSLQMLVFGKKNYF